MSESDLKSILKSNSYPGRGIVIGITPDNANVAIAYFTMGRSVNSRNRIFVEDGEGIRNEAFDPSKMTDPSLIIYSPVRVIGDSTIVTNGDQTDTVFEYMQSGKNFEDALKTRTFEPDPPNYTPRISGIIDVACGKPSYKLSILKTVDGVPNVCRFFFDYAETVVGKGHFIHTYRCDGDPIPSFSGDPVLVGINNDFEEFSAEIWEALNEDNKVSLFARFINVKDGSVKSKIFNKLK